jgi:Asp-tRNA(Asn)/Glu-tRNA(Gln) amidotransferase A subunit family amidase
LSEQDVIDTWIQRDMLRAHFLEQMRNYPILLCPPAAIPAFRHGERNWTVEGRKVDYLDAWSYTEWFNLLGNPAAVVPITHSEQGLPVGVQIVGRPWEEEQVLSIAAIVESSCNGWRVPPIS